jgi:hypothetical protein
MKTRGNSSIVQIPGKWEIQSLSQVAWIQALFLTSIARIVIETNRNNFQLPSKH